jgi:hypothetical protein
METFICPFFISVEFAVVTGVSATSGVVVLREGVTVGAGEFAAFVCLIVGIVHPATRTHPTIRKKVRSMYFFIGFLPGDVQLLRVIFYQLTLWIVSCCVLVHNKV